MSEPTGRAVVYSLTIHADYACRHAGACCRVGWPIPMGLPLQQQLDAQRAAGRLILPLRESDACIYYEGDDAHPRGGRCAIHRQLGEPYKPPSCRHFPRVALLDARGVSVTLSHYCPTAASMLFREDIELAITDRPAAYPQFDDYEGLDARGVLPPLLRPGMLWDLDGYSAWERHAIALLARQDMTPERALDLLGRLAAEIERWCPADGQLAHYVGQAFSSMPGVPEPSSSWGEKRTVVNRYLAARLFASWVPYRSERLGALVQDLARAHQVLREEAARHRAGLVEAIRATDLRIVHAGS